MKKALSILLAFSLIVALAACSGGEPATPASETPAASPSPAPVALPSPEKEEAPAPEEPKEPDPPAQLVSIDGNVITVRDDGSGEVTKDSGMKKTPILTARNIGYKGEAGPIVYTVNGIQVASMNISDEDSASVLGVEKGEDFTLVAIDMTVENTSDDDISFYPYMSTIVTNTKDQIESNWLLSDSVGGDFLGNVEKSGQIFWICENVNADDLSHIKWRIDSPHDEDYDHFGDDVVIEFEFVK